MPTQQGTPNVLVLIPESFAYTLAAGSVRRPRGQAMEEHRQCREAIHVREGDV